MGIRVERLPGQGICYGGQIIRLADGREIAHETSWPSALISIRTVNDETGEAGRGLFLDRDTAFGVMKAIQECIADG